ncbi:hypothetical protein HGB13_01620 [bacterium]|nr:hypothetical protein [bacterium]
MKNTLRLLTSLVTLLFLALFLRFFMLDIMENEHGNLKLLLIFAILGLGGFVIYKIARFIEDITAILKDKTGLAGGLLQALGTAFPDMIIGITAAFMSLKAAGDPTSAINYAIVAASTTFGSNVYNIGHAAWCMWRQNLANKYHKNYKMFPIFGGGTVKPMHEHKSTPQLIEMNTAIKVLVSLTFLTVVVVMGMVFFGKVPTPEGFTGDLYKLKAEIGVFVLVSVLITLYMFRKNYGSHQEDEENPFRKVGQLTMWVSLLICGGAILFTAESMVETILEFSELTHIPIVISGMIAGLIGCLGEMVVIHNFTVNPKGRIGDAIVGVAMDNIVTIMGAAIIAAMGGIFLGGDSLIVIFVLILAANSVLIWQVSELKDEYIEHKELNHV